MIVSPPAAVSPATGSFLLTMPCTLISRRRRHGCQFRLALRSGKRAVPERALPVSGSVVEEIGIQPADGLQGILVHGYRDVLVSFKAFKYFILFLFDAYARLIVFHAQHRRETNLPGQGTRGYSQ